MKTIDIFNKSSKIEEKRRELEGQLNQLETDQIILGELCPHEIVFKYTDNFPRMLNIDGTYYCPACGKSIRVLHKKDFMDSPFKKSRIIPLTNLSLMGTNEVYTTIKQEVVSNIQDYYDPEMPVEELEYRMEMVLEDKQIKYKGDGKVLKKSI